MALNRNVLDVVAGMDTGRIVGLLTSRQLLDTEAGDAILGHMAGNHPGEYEAVMAALGRAEV